MKKQIKTMEQLRDSRLLFEKKLPAFGFILILIITFSLIGVIIWSVYAHKSYMIISQGTVTSSDAAYVMSAYSGVIEESYMQEGKLVGEGDVLFTIRSTDYNLQEEQLLLNRKAYENRLEKLELLIKSVKDDINYFDSSKAEDSFYYSSFEAYKSQVMQNTFDASTYKSYGYSDEQIENEIKKNQAKIEEIYHSTIKTVESSINEVSLQIASIDSQLSAIESGQTEYSIKASNSGILHMMADYKEGMVVQAGNAVANITPENSDIVIETYISTADRARIKEGDTVQLAVDGLVQSIYGNVTGTVASIDSNLTSLESQNGQSNPVFKIRIKPGSTYLVSSSGNKVNLINGMTLEARVTYDEVTYFNYVMEKLGFITR